MTLEPRGSGSPEPRNNSQWSVTCHGVSYDDPAGLTLPELNSRLDVIEDALARAQNRHERHEARSASFVGAAPVAFAVMLVQMIMSKQLDLAKYPWWAVSLLTIWFAVVLWILSLGIPRLWDYLRFGDDIDKLQMVRRAYRAAQRDKEDESRRAELKKEQRRKKEQRLEAGRATAQQNRIVQHKPWWRRG